MDDSLMESYTSLAPTRGGWRGRLLNQVLRYYFKRRLQRIEFNAAGAVDMRRRMELIASGAPRLTLGLQVEQKTIASVPVEVLSPRGPIDALPVVLYLHGGAFVAGSPRTHRPITAKLAQALPARVFALDYRLAPEYPYPAAQDDVVAVYRDVLERVNAARIAVVGDSAGGNLVLTSILRARDEGLPVPAAAVAMSPWTDLTGSGQSVVANAACEAMLPGERIEQAARVYAPQADLTQPYLSPVFADFAGFPPLLLHVGTTEVLRDDATRTLSAAREAGVDAQLRLWEDLPHVFQIFARHLPAARVAIDEMVEFLSEALEASATTGVKQ